MSGVSGGCRDVISVASRDVEELKKKISKVLLTTKLWGEELFVLLLRHKCSVENLWPLSTLIEMHRELPYKNPPHICIFQIWEEKRRENEMTLPPSPLAHLLYVPPSPRPLAFARSFHPRCCRSVSSIVVVACVACFLLVAAVTFLHLLSHLLLVYNFFLINI